MADRVEFHPLVSRARGGEHARFARNLTDDQWLRFMGTIDDREGWYWSLPETAGAPARLLPPGESMTWRFDADGSAFREPFTPAESS